MTFGPTPNREPLESPETPPKPDRLWRLLRFTGNALRIYFARLLRIEEQHKPEIYKSVFQGAEFADLNYWLEIIFSIGIATLGLIINSPAVVIGAMLISPLMGPIIASGLAIALGDFYLGFKSFLNVAMSTLGSILLAALITWLLPFRSPTAEILARVQPSLLDLGVAVLSGMAGAVVICRGGRGGGITALPGVAVAVALIPPLGVVGFGVGAGWEWAIIKGGGLLFLTNLVAIIFSSFLVFFSVRLDTTTARQQISEWIAEQKAHERFHEAIQRTPLRRMLGRVGSLPQRLLILAMFLAMVAFPLQRTLARLRQEAFIRRTVIDEVNKVIPRDSMFQETIEISPDRLNVRLVATGLPPERRQQLEEVIEARTNLPTKLTVFNVATREELSEWTGRLMASRSEPIMANVEELRAKLLARIEPAVAATWPRERAPLLHHEVAMEPQSPRLRLSFVFLSKEDLGPLGEEAILRSLRERIGSASVDASFVRVMPERAVSFRPGSSQLSDSARRELTEVVLVLRRYPSARCALGMAMPEGKELRPLAKRRADRIRTFLTEEQGLDPQRIGMTPFDNGRDRIMVSLVSSNAP